LLLRYRQWLYSALRCPWKEMPTDAEELKANPVQLNPNFVDWLQGWPIGFTDLEPPEMVSWRLRLVSHSRYLLGG
jgi:hypothetical protein